MNHLVTGYRGEAHVTASQQGVYNAGTVGEGDYILPVGGKLTATVVDNNTIRISDGALLMQGRFVCVESAEDLTISSGVAGENRIDLVVMRYEKDSTSGVESASLVVIEGESATETATTPTITEGNILSGDISHEVALWQININGISIESVSSLCETAPLPTAIGEKCEILDRKIVNLTTVLNSKIDIIDSKFETPYKTDVDLDSLYNEGTYLVQGDLTNAPENCTLGWVEVYNRSNTWIKQIFYRYGTTEEVSAKMFVRNRYSDGTWGEWKRYALVDDIPTICAGEVSVGTVSGNNGTVSKSVTFPITFESVPTVVVSFNSGATNLKVWVANVTATGFTVVTQNTGTSTVSSVALSYMAC